MRFARWPDTVFVVAVLLSTGLPAGGAPVDRRSIPAAFREGAGRLEDLSSEALMKMAVEDPVRWLNPFSPGTFEQRIEWLEGVCDPVNVLLERDDSFRAIFSVYGRLDDFGVADHAVGETFAICEALLGDRRVFGQASPSEVRDLLGTVLLKYNARNEHFPDFPSTIGCTTAAWLVARCLDRLGDPGCAKWTEEPENRSAVTHPLWTGHRHHEVVPEIIELGREHLRRSLGGR